MQTEGFSLYIEMLEFEGKSNWLIVVLKHLINFIYLEILKVKKKKNLKLKLS